MKKLASAIACILMLHFLSSCNIINPKEEIPTYVYIDSFTVQATDPQVHGSTSHKITDAWVFLNNDLIGTYELPAKIPLILLNDTNSLSISAGIWDNGQSGVRVRYPFYVLSNQTISPSPGNTIPIYPATSYNQNAKFLLLEDFEQGNAFIKYVGADTTLIQTSDPTYVFEGSKSGLISLSRAGSYIGAQSITTQPVVLPSNLQSYLEFDYKCDVDISVKAQITGSGAPLITGNIIYLRSRADWNKIYINLTQFAVNYPARNFNFIFEVTTPAEKSTAFFAVDNFKVVSF